MRSIFSRDSLRRKARNLASTRRHGGLCSASTTRHPRRGHHSQRLHLACELGSLSLHLQLGVPTRAGFQTSCLHTSVKRLAVLCRLTGEEMQAVRDQELLQLCRAALTLPRSTTAAKAAAAAEARLSKHAATAEAQPSLPPPSAPSASEPDTSLHATAVAAADIDSQETQVIDPSEYSPRVRRFLEERDRAAGSAESPHRRLLKAWVAGDVEVHPSPPRGGACQPAAHHQNTSSPAGPAPAAAPSEQKHAQQTGVSEVQLPLDPQPPIPNMVAKTAADSELPQEAKPKRKISRLLAAMLQGAPIDGPTA